MVHFLLPPRSLARCQRNCCQQSQEGLETLCSGRCSWEGSPDPADSLTPIPGLQAAVTPSLLMSESTTPAKTLPQLLLPTTLLRRLSLKHSLGPFAHIPSQGLNIHPPALSAISSFLFTQILAPSTSLPSRLISSILYSHTVGSASLRPTVHLLHSLFLANIHLQPGEGCRHSLMNKTRCVQQKKESTPGHRATSKPLGKPTTHNNHMKRCSASSVVGQGEGNKTSFSSGPNNI